jgi:hypothetical protein
VAVRVASAAAIASATGPFVGVVVGASIVTASAASVAVGMISRSPALAAALLPACEGPQAFARVRLG